MSGLPRILLVEDDKDLAELTANYLSNYGYDVNIESNGEYAVERILNDRPDLLILDLMLPGKDGLEICKELRPDFQQPILMLTARTEQLDQILGLEMGSDDYVCKPIEPRLLLARVKALLRRTERDSAHFSTAKKPEIYRYKFDNIEIDNRARRVLLEGNEIHLTMPEYEVLWILADNAGEILSRDMLFKEIRGFDYDGTNRFVDLTISQLRSKIDNNPKKPARIKTVRGQGYLFVPHYI